MRPIYRVTQIRSKRATERENLEPRTVENQIGEFNIIEKAKIVYNETKTGTEVDKELVKITGEIEEIIETTY